MPPSASLLQNSSSNGFELTTGRQNNSAYLPRKKVARIQFNVLLHHSSSTSWHLVGPTANASSQPLRPGSCFYPHSSAKPGERSPRSLHYTARPSRSA